jgi:hypothetical protein
MMNEDIRSKFAPRNDQTNDKWRSDRDGLRILSRRSFHRQPLESGTKGFRIDDDSGKLLGIDRG